MKLILSIVAIAVLGYMAYATHLIPTASRPSTANAPPTMTAQQAAAQQGLEPWVEKEKREGADESRDRRRRSMADKLGQAWSSFCTEAGHAKLVQHLSGFYGGRARDREVYRNIWGEPGERHILSVWATTDDNRIHRLTRELYHNGYFRPEETDTYAQRTLAEVLKGERVAGHPCGS